MSGYLERLREGERLWVAEGVLRVCGLALLGACYRAALLAHALVTARPPHQTSLAEFAVCAATFVLLICGLALTFEGPGLFRHLPIPAHSAYFTRN